jgi:hypothetical protein
MALIMSVCNVSFVPLHMLLFDVFGEMCGENSCNVFLLLYGTLGSYLRDALQEGSAHAVACLRVSRA